MRWAVSLVLLAVVATAAYPLVQGLREVIDRRFAAAPAASPAAPVTTRSPDEPGRVRVVPSEVVIVYRWRDAKGTVHFESEPPPEGVEAEVIEMRRPAKVVPVEGAGAEPEGAGPGDGPGAEEPEPFSVYTPGGMDELLRRLDSTLDSLGERQRAMRELERDL